MSDPRYHSVAAVIPFLIAATVFALARIGAPRRTIAAAAVLTCSAMLALVVGPWARAVGQTPLGGREQIPAAHVAALRDAVALVPDDAPVSSSNSVGAHLSARRYVYSVPVLRARGVGRHRPRGPVGRERGVADTHEASRGRRGFVARLERDDSWQRVFERDGVVVFRKRDE